MTDRYPLLKFLAFTLVCAVFAVWLVFVIGNVSLDARRPYEGVFEDVSGLLVNDHVKISGVTVGKVEAIELIDGGQAKVRFTVSDDIDLGEDSSLEIRWRDVFGLRFLYVHPAGDGVLPEEHTFPAEATVGPADLGVLLERITPFMQALDPDKQNQVLQALSEALVGRTAEVQQLIRDGASLTQTLADRDAEIGRVLENAVTVLDAYARRETELRGLIDAFADVADTLAERNDTLETAVINIADAQEELGRMLEANDGEVRDALDALDAITTVLAFRQDELENIVTTSARGTIAYHRISRLGQWFNIRAVGVSSDYDTISAERGATLPADQSGGSSATSFGRFFGASLSLGGGR